MHYALWSCGSNFFKPLTSPEREEEEDIRVSGFELKKISLDIVCHVARHSQRQTNFVLPTSNCEYLPFELNDNIEALSVLTNDCFLTVNSIEA